MNAEELIERLKKSFNAPSKKDERIKVVLICIVISTTFWFFNALNQDNYTSQIDYPIEWNYDDSQYMAIADMPASVPLEVTGGGWDLMTRFFGFNMSPLSIALEEPANSVYLLTSQLRAELSRNLDPVSINFLIQDSLKYDIQPIVKRRLKLIFDPKEVQFDSDYRLNSPYRLSPDSITVEGPESIIDQMPEVWSIGSKIERIDADFINEIDLPNLPKFVTTELEQVTLSFEVMQYLTITENREVQLINFPDTSWRAFPEEIRVDYEIGESAFDAADSSRIELVADYKQWNAQDSTVLLEVIQRQRLIENVQLSSQSVKIVKQ